MVKLNMNLAQWRNFQTKQDIQDQKLKRRQSASNQGLSPCASDIDSDGELLANFEEYDPHKDLRISHKRLTELNNLFWTEDELFRKNVNVAQMAKRKTIAVFENNYASTMLGDDRNDSGDTSTDNERNHGTNVYNGDSSDETGNQNSLSVNSTLNRKQLSQLSQGNLRSDLSSDQKHLLIQKQIVKK